jgi:hypothetical protein
MMLANGKIADVILKNQIKVAMNQKVEEKISELIESSELAFSNPNVKNAVHNAREAGEALCKAIIFNHYRETFGEEIILGKKNYKEKPRKSKPDLSELITIVTQENEEQDSKYIIITNKTTRDKIKSYLELIRSHGNPASHNANVPADKINSNDLSVTKQALNNLIIWFFKDYLGRDIPTELKPFISSSLPIIPTEFKTIIEDKTKIFCGRQFVFDAITAFIQNHQSGYFTILGDAGMGKSAIAAKYIVDNPGTICFFNIRTDGTNRPDQFLKSICQQLVNKDKIKIIYVMCALKSPVSREMIVKYSQQDNLTVQEVLKDWTQFLQEQKTYQPPRYRFYHESFRDFLQRQDIVEAAGVSLPEIGAEVANKMDEGLIL